jgi:flavin reductase (DIM6/NTAB) family NADH-FMN oxidoreductase RutF
MLRSAVELSQREAYYLLIDSIVPRPIAWVTTVSASGVPNLAPFSFFTGVSAQPPTLAISIASRVTRGKDGAREVRPKDTLVNLRGTGEFIVHVAPGDCREQVLRSSENHPPEVDEIALCDLDTVPGSFTNLPRISSLPVAMECRLLREVGLGDPPTTLVIGEVLGWHIDDAMLGEDGRIYSEGWQPLARLGVEGFQALKDGMGS